MELNPTESSTLAHDKIKGREDFQVGDFDKVRGESPFRFYTNFKI